MVDNTQVPGGTGDVVRDKDRSGIKTQVVGIDVSIGTGTEALMSLTNPMPVRIAATATTSVTSVLASVTAVTLVAASTARLGLTFYNDSTSIMYIVLSATAASATFHTYQVPGGGYYEIPFGYQGAVGAIWAAAGGSVRITDMST